MKHILLFVSFLTFSYTSFSQAYPEWEAIKYNYSVNISEEMQTKTGILKTTKEDATLSVSNGSLFSGGFNNAGDPILLVSCSPTITSANYFSVDYHTFLYSTGGLSGWDIAGTMFDLSSGNPTIKTIVRSNVPIAIQVQLVDANGHVTNNSTIISDTVYDASVNDTCTFQGFIMEDWYSESWWGMNNERGENAAFPQNAIIPVDTSKIVSLRFTVTVLDAANTDPITLSFRNIQISGSAPILILPPQETITPYYETSDTLYISDFFFDANTNLDNIAWDFVPSDPSVVVEYNAELGIIVISNLSKPTTVDIVATNDLGFYTTERYIVFYINELASNDKKISVWYNPMNKTLSYKDIGTNTLQLYTPMGNLILETHSSSSEIDVSNISTGVYFYSIYTNQKQYSGTIIIK